MLLKRSDSPEIPIKTLPDFNSKLWGIHSKKLMVIGARTSIGKSAFALQLAWDIALQKKPVLFLSLEMYEEDLIERLFCLSQKVNNMTLLKGKFSEVEHKWADFERELNGIPFVITDMIGKTCQQIEDYLQKLTVKPKVIIIDHLQEAKDASKLNQKDVVDEYLKGLRVLAIREDIAIIICSQINRASQEKTGSEPQLHHLKSSGYVEESADMIVLLHWPYHYDKSKDMNDFVLNVAKNRNGRTGWVNIKYKPENYWFYEEMDLEKQVHGG